MDAFQGVNTGACVSVDHPEWFVLLREIVNQLHQHQMLSNVGMVAGAEGVAVAQHEVDRGSGKVGRVGA